MGPIGRGVAGGARRGWPNAGAEACRPRRHSQQLSGAEGGPTRGGRTDVTGAWAKKCEGARQTRPLRVFKRVLPNRGRLAQLVIRALICARPRCQRETSELP